MKKDNAKLLIFGILNACSFIPTFVISIFIGLLLMSFGAYILAMYPSSRYDVFLNISSIILVCILFVPIITCIIGIIYGILNRKQQRYGLACCILSAVGLVIAVLGTTGMWYVGSHF